MKSTVTKVYNTAKTYVSKAYTAVKNTVTKTYNAVKTTVTKGYNAVKSYATNVKERVVQTTQTAIAHTQKTVKTAYEKAVELEHLEEPVTVYNFEVEDYHTYYVGDAEVLVHNTCIETMEINQMSRKEDFRQAKESAGIPKSSQYNTHRFVYDNTSENRTVYEFTVDGKKKYIIEHTEDKMGRGKHFHGADDLKMEKRI